MLNVIRKFLPPAEKQIEYFLNDLYNNFKWTSENLCNDTNDVISKSHDASMNYFSGFMRTWGRLSKSGEPVSPSQKL